ncbi:MAG: hypothetical protein E6G87_04565 [Alphaproteobacteria bacterium]|nr:MAG: hypothetical protein E6G87_04565 [Alphaproteobacteria bacterium]
MPPASPLLNSSPHRSRPPNRSCARKNCPKPSSRRCSWSATCRCKWSRRSRRNPRNFSMIGSRRKTVMMPRSPSQPPTRRPLPHSRAKATPIAASPEKEQIVAVEALPEPANDNTAATDKAPAPEVQADAEPAQDSSTAHSGNVELTGWSVQLSSARDEKVAWGTWDKLKARHKALSDMKPVVVRADLGKKGIYYRLRIGGFDTQADAKSACGKLKSRGLTCFISRIDS